MSIRALLSDFEFEDHTVITDEGYKLTLWHVYNKGINPNSTDITPLFLMHGFMDEGTTWLFAERSKNMLF